MTPLSLPGVRYRQFNGNGSDTRLWRQKKYWTMAKAYWTDLAKVLGNHPAIVAFYILNEPAPEQGQGTVEHAGQGHAEQLAAWFGHHKGTAADLYLFYQDLFAAIRQIDSEMPIMVSPGWFAQPAAITYWPGPLKDPFVLYAVHMYEPYAFTSGSNYRQKKHLSYPGPIPFAGKTMTWDSDRVASYMRPFFE